MYRGDSRAVFVVGPAGRPDHEPAFSTSHLFRFQTQENTSLRCLMDHILERPLVWSGSQ